MKTPNSISQILGILGTVASILAVVPIVISFIETPKHVVLWVEKARLYGLPTHNQDGVRDEGENFGSVLVGISNESGQTISDPKLQFVGIEHFAGIKVVRASLSQNEILPLEHTWNKKIVEDPKDTIIKLPPLSPNDGITVQAFGNNAENVEPKFSGSEYHVNWIIAITDSRPYHYLFANHMLVWLLTALLVVSIMLVIVAFRKENRKAGSLPA